LLIAAIYAASMSTISAGLNSLASATVVDFKQRLSSSPEGTQAQQVGSARWITVIYGVIVVALAFAVSFMPGNLVESVNTVIGLIGGPLLGLFFLGMFTQRATTRGALLGCLAGFVTLLGIFMYQNGAFTALKPPMLVSFIWFSLLGTIITMAVGLLTSGRSAPSSNRHQ
jgi:sodium-coupled monocarboxylate transporter 8/12